MFTNKIQTATGKILRSLLAAALLAAPLASSATSPSPEWYLRENLLKAVSSDANARNLVTAIAEQIGLKCHLNLNDVMDEHSMSITYEPQTFTAHYYCIGSNDIIVDVNGKFTPEIIVDVNGTFAADFVTLTRMKVTGVSIKK